MSFSIGYVVGDFGIMAVDSRITIVSYYGTPVAPHPGATYDGRNKLQRLPRGWIASTGHGPVGDAVRERLQSPLTQESVAAALAAVRGRLTQLGRTSFVALEVVPSGDPVLHRFDTDGGHDVGARLVFAPPFGTEHGDLDARMRALLDRLAVAGSPENAMRALAREFAAVAASSPYVSNDVAMGVIVAGQRFELPLHGTDLPADDAELRALLRRVPESARDLAAAAVPP